MITSVLMLIFAYLLGSINSAILLAKLCHLPSPTKSGSGNPGASNMLRIGGKKLAIFTLLGDMAKGIIPVLLAKFLLLPISTIHLIALVVVIGHMFPIFFKFKGGKGVATLFGVAFAINLYVGVILFLTWATIAFVSRYAAVASLLVAILFPALDYLFFHNMCAMALSVLLSVFIIAKHHANIVRLCKGKENKLKSGR
ncbi:MAG: acyl-phosphate glycerol 3-phosphate acyltransferase [Thiotrichales bacterium]|nr:MAG: acyl-phosphate glycerol 3-phosphate acyltransferase [Thiotrichales bacterium]